MNLYYDKDGQLVEIEKAAYGTTVTKDGNTIYYVKANRGTVYDPFDTTPKYKHEKWELKKVTESVYKSYVTFLKTTSTKFKQFAEREMRDE